MTFLALTFLYLGAIIILVGVMPWNRAGITESPFVSVFRSVDLPGAGHLMNFVVLTAALSGANAALYVSSRMLFSLARTGWAPAALGRLSAKGTPTRALLVSSYGIVVALVLERWAASNAFVYILRGALFGMMLSWIISLAAHISFRRRLTSAPGRGTAHALSLRSRGFSRRLDRRPGFGGQNLVGFPRQPDQRSGHADWFDGVVLPSSPQEGACPTRGTIGSRG